MRTRRGAAIALAVGAALALAGCSGSAAVEEVNDQLPDLTSRGLEPFECGTGVAIGGSFQEPQDGYRAECWRGAPAGETFIDIANGVQDDVRLATGGVDATAVYCPQDALGEVGGIACRVTEVDGEVIIRTVVILSDIASVIDGLAEEPTDADVQEALAGAEVEVLVGTETVPES